MALEISKTYNSSVGDIPRFYGNFSIAPVTWHRDFGIIFGCHANGDAYIFSSIIDGVSLKFGEALFSGKAYITGITSLDNKIYFTDYSSNNGSFKYLDLGSRAVTTVSSSGYGYGGVPLFTMGDSVKRCLPVSTEYSFGNIKNPDGLQLNFSVKGGIRDLAHFNENYYILGGGSRKLDNSSPSDSTIVYVSDSVGNLIDSISIDVNSNESLCGIAIDEDRSCIYIPKVKHLATSSPIICLYEIPVGSQINIKCNINGQMKETDSMSVKIDNSWKEVDSVFVKIGNEWKLSE